MELTRVIANLISPKEGNAVNASLSPIDGEEAEGAEMDQEGLEDEGLMNPPRQESQGSRRAQMHRRNRR